MHGKPPSKTLLKGETAVGIYNAVRLIRSEELELHLLASKLNRSCLPGLNVCDLLVSVC